MDFTKIAQAAIPVVVGIFAAGYLMNALRDNAVVKGAIKGYDAA